MCLIFAYPVVMLAIFASVLGHSSATADFSFAQYFLPGMIATGILLSSFQNLAITIAVERDEGGLKRLRGTPMPVTSYFIGKIGLVLVTSLVQTALLLGVAAILFGVPMPSSASAWATFTWVFVLGSATGCVCGIGFSSVPRSGRAASAVVTPVVLVLQFISGVFFQFENLPTRMQRCFGLPAQVDGSGHALGLPACHLCPDHRGWRFLAARRNRGRLGSVARPRAPDWPAEIPVDPARQRLSSRTSR